MGTEPESGDLELPMSPWEYKGTTLQPPQDCGQGTNLAVHLMLHYTSPHLQLPVSNFLTQGSNSFNSK